MREPLTEENTGRLDEILARVVGKPFQVLVLIVFIGGIQGVNFWINQMGYLIQYPRYKCVFEAGLTEEEKEGLCTQENICAGDERIVSSSIDHDSPNTLDNWHEKLDL